MTKFLKKGKIGGQSSVPDFLFLGGKTVSLWNENHWRICYWTTKNLEILEVAMRENFLPLIPARALFTRDRQPRPLEWMVRQLQGAAGSSDARWHIQSLTHLCPFSSDQMIRNLSMKIGDVGLGSIELACNCPDPWNSLPCVRLPVHWVVVNSGAKGTTGDHARCLCVQLPVPPCVQ